MKSTTLREVRAAAPERGMLEDMLSKLDKSDTETITLLTILDKCGLESTLWVISNVMGGGELERRYLDWCHSIMPEIPSGEPKQPLARRPLCISKNWQFRNCGLDPKDFMRSHVWTCIYDGHYDITGGSAYDVTWELSRVATRDAAFGVVKEIPPDTPWGVYFPKAQDAGWKAFDESVAIQEAVLRSMLEDI